MTDEWYTSDDLLNECKEITQLAHRSFCGVYELDPCSGLANRRSIGLDKTAITCIDRPASGLLIPWFGHVFVNPPYSLIEPWVDKAIEESRVPHGPSSITMLLPANRTEQPWFQKIQNEIITGRYIRFLPRRRGFIDQNGKLQKSPRFGLVVVVLRRAYGTQINW